MSDKIVGHARAAAAELTTARESAQAIAGARGALVDKFIRWEGTLERIRATAKAVNDHFNTAIDQTYGGADAAERALEALQSHESDEVQAILASISVAREALWYIEGQLGEPVQSSYNVQAAAGERIVAFEGLTTDLDLFFAAADLALQHTTAGAAGGNAYADNLQRGGQPQ